MSARRTPGRERAVDGAMPVAPTVLVLCAVAMVFLGAGAIGLVTPETLPMVARPAVAWSLVAAGAMIDVGAMLMLLSARRVKSRQR
jgi:hypothetical protein